MEKGRETIPYRGKDMKYEGERCRACWGMMWNGLLAKTWGQSREMVGNKAKMVGFNYTVLCLGSEALEINLVVDVSH